MLVVKGASGSHTPVKEKKIPHPQLASSQLLTPKGKNAACVFLPTSWRLNLHKKTCFRFNT